MLGGNGNDNIFGAADDDDMRGEAGNDFLDGDGGTADRGDGGADIDECLNIEIESNCEI